MSRWYQTVSIDIETIEDCSANMWQVWCKKQWPQSAVIGVQCEGDKEWADPRNFAYGPGCKLNTQRAMKDGYILLRISHPA